MTALFLLVSVIYVASVLLIMWQSKQTIEKLREAIQAQRPTIQMPKTAADILAEKAKRPKEVPTNWMQAKELLENPKERVSNGI